MILHSRTHIWLYTTLAPIWQSYLLPARPSAQALASHAVGGRYLTPAISSRLTGVSWMSERG
jgi:hypothetical protein